MEHEDRSSVTLERDVRAQTFVPARLPLEHEPAKRQLRGLSRSGTLNLLGALLAGICCSTLLFGRVAALSGPIGWVLVSYAFFLVAYIVLTMQTEDGPAVKDAVMTVMLFSAAAIVLITLLSVLVFTFVKGLGVFRRTNFFTQDLSRTGPLDPLKQGGIFHAIVGTIWMIAIALVVTIPLGIVTAVYLSETRSRFARLVRTLVEAMTALPSIVAGLFIYASLEVTFHQQKSGLAAALALSVMMLPIMTRASDVVLRLVPGSLREASAALGAPSWRTVWQVVLPTARSGLATAVILATARGIGETSPVLLTAGYTNFTNKDPLHGPMVSLPLLVFKLIGSGQRNYIDRGYGAACFLLLLVLLLFITARLIGGRGPGHQNARKRHRNARRSARYSRRLGRTSSEAS